MSSSSGFHQVLIGGYPTGGLTQDRKPAFLANEAYSTLENAYVFRERTKKRDGEVPIGRLTRSLSSQALGNASDTGTFSGNLVSIFSLETNAQIVPGTVVVVDGLSLNILTDKGVGV